MDSRIKKLIAALGLIIIIMIGLISFSNYASSQKGTVNISFMLGGQGAVIKFNGQIYKTENSKSLSYVIPSGQVALSIRDAGYQNYNSKFKLDPGETVGINVNLKPSQRPLATNLSDIIVTPINSKTTTTLLKLYPAATSSTAVYFDNYTWAYLTIDTNEGFGAAYLILQYDNSLGRWVIVGGPSYDNDNLGNITSYPTDIQQYFESQGYNDDGDLD